MIIQDEEFLFGRGRGDCFPLAHMDLKERLANQDLAVLPDLSQAPEMRKPAPVRGAGWWGEVGRKTLVQPLCSLELLTVICGRPAHQFLEHPVEVRQRLEPDLVGNFAHTQIGVQQ